MEMAGALPWLIFAITLLVASIKSSTAFGMTKPGCMETCGNLTIPYPFGIGPGCFYGEAFNVSCKNNTAIWGDPSDGFNIYVIDLPRQQFQFSIYIATNCFNESSGWASLRTDSLFSISSNANKLTALGCNTLVFQQGGSNNTMLGGGCYSMCANKQSMDLSGQCSGLGCCQTSIPPLTFTNITFDDRFDNSVVSDFNPCSYAFVAAQDWFEFDPSYLEGYRTFEKKFPDGVPIVLDWVVGEESCDEANKNASSYACISKNGDCINSQVPKGYVCRCNRGFEGNPYLEEGCKDIDECHDRVRYL